MMRFKRFTGRSEAAVVSPAESAEPAPVVQQFERARTCRAPAVAMNFSLYGTVVACCENVTYAYGDVRTQSIAEIWEGMPRRIMVEELNSGSYPPGCEHCEVERRLGNRKSTPAHSFDRFSADPGTWPKKMEFILSNRCNLACIHCNGDNSSTIRSKREGRPPMEMPYGEAFFEQLPPFLDHLEVASFLGGEPFLTPEVRRVWDLLLERGLRPEVQVTTNATVWNERVERYVYGLQMHFAVSIDGATKETFEKVRERARYDRVIENRDRMLAATKEYGAYFQLNYCLLPANVHEVGLFLLQADELDVPANIIPVHQPANHSLFALSADELREVIGRLEDEEATLLDQLGRNRAAWDSTMYMLRTQLERLDMDWDRSAELAGLRSEQIVRLRSRDEPSIAYLLPKPVPTEAQILQAEMELIDWAGRPFIEIAIDGELIASVSAPEWAEPLQAQSWVGHQVDELGELVEARLGPVTGGNIDEPIKGIRQITSEVTTPEGPLAFHAVLLPDSGRLLLATSGDLARRSATSG